jgi:hypothetical protein
VAAGFEFIQKPFAIKELLCLLHELLGSHRAP